MNFIDRAFHQNLTGDDFLQAMSSIYAEPEVYKILNQYPAFVADVISIIDYDTVMQMDGFDAMINGNLSDWHLEIIHALDRCGAEREASILREAKNLSDLDKDRYEEQYEEFSHQIALNNDYEDFWDIVRRYIDRNLTKTKKV
ncbi:DMP19 family protein [Listeria costaricensis]|uniref:DMP19 family protein n=1 Tax=Listeria costaricensis TaxID=2026604 RepID=UPI000C06F099|nr:hypothetical protein [Listeria costaricensis]